MACLPIWEAEFHALLEYCQAKGHLPFGITTLEHLASEISWTLTGIRDGFKIIDTEVTHIPPYEVRNYPLVYQHEEVITQEIQKELDQGIIYETTEKPRYLTALNCKVETDKIRTLRDLSAPHGKAINNFTWNNSNWHMMSVDHAIHLMRDRANHLMAKVDISNAYRTVPVHPDDHHYLGFEWLTKYYIDTRLPFGLSNAPEIFVRITNLVRSMLIRRGIEAVVVYVDDFLVFGKSQEQCQHAWLATKALLSALGFVVNNKAHKSVPPTTSLTFLGIVLDTDTHKDGTGVMQARVTQERLDKAIAECASVERQQVIPRKQLEKLLGTLNFIAKVVYGARPYLRRLIDCLHSGKSHSIHIDRGMKLDLIFWKTFATDFNGKAIIIEKPMIPYHFFSVDAATTGTKGVGGIGGFFNGKYFGIPLTKLIKYGTKDHKRAAHRRMHPTPHRKETMDITYLELFVVWWAATLWDTEWAGYHLTIHTDNEGVRYMLNKGTARKPHFMPLLRAITKRMALGGYRLQAQRITTDENVLADPLSRGDWPKFNTEFKKWRAKYEGHMALHLEKIQNLTGNLDHLPFTLAI